MRHRTGYVTVVVIVAVLSVSGVATATVGAAPVGPAAQQQAGGSQQQADGACDYTALYEDSIDSVVSVQQVRGQGSGFVYQTGGNGSASYVVTNAHVVGNATDVTVQFRGGESLPGTVVGTDVYSDLAVVRVNETPGYVEALPVAENQTEHGERVAALGSPFGLEETITHGIVSGLNRSMPTRLGFEIPNVVQTDAPISPGNSGGPLVSCDGAVVGVNTAGIAAQGAENIGFAVSSTAVERVVPSLIETGEFTHPALGISGTGVTPAIADANDLESDRGVIVASVNEGAPAAEVLQGSDRVERADRQFVPIGGDVIVAVDGQNVSTSEELASVLLAETRPGDEVALTIVRDGERMTVNTTVIERPDPEASPGPNEGQP
ncbi:serine protease, S1-C subfamily, contains C-terminal PDZ domain [Halomicrobium zhouii]|uniref:Serine protease, S1-C subfamily, contains C-terminal PDZ domain n=1 Tax=Halomicrobium zhouii TaxID=767519 RepID=A0A1I6LZK0_9EURY|nr:trypsin-like peptidase domain-containing protein [Halomicrobium zhouii]SFS08814.1 serine protease, S1-C subfamily, contains C-terminal PDZ domain [Halomicrobium zhouii]